MDTREYEVEFIDGTTERYSANIVAENIYSQCDLEGNQYLVLKEIVDHKSDESALRVNDRYPVGRNGKLYGFASPFILPQHSSSRFLAVKLLS